ncbi:MlaD family protein [Azospirillum rugosum]|uniref:Phospholipid/cholesterol/gamma-HCH transport system substrate-binding protein n=1 Tax=Azospirillum rugosum TaxID=416170 RepID=A0ABS4SD07_9PROT|nr:MlaD family protein [Azospirillum rugosum]MBP2290461.1 phospholipid/cholesterol/gamma-HCH transport system substrate-binding protein [Azospirillum rugosum]MDQ0525349.1 phospholipid/cholesterol/gamma-HCH transport system substrate-binding protein [Azospirillum rugosum]
METRASYILVGSFVLALLAGLFVFTVWVAKVQLEETRQPYYIYFTGSVTGLQEGSPVRYRGIPVGTVTDIRLDPNDVSRVRVTIEVQEGTPIKTDSIASLEVQGITGGAYIQISGGTELSELLRTAHDSGTPVIPSRPSSLTVFVDAAPQLLNRALDLTNRMADLLTPQNQAAIADILQSTRTLTAELAKASNGLESTMQQAGRTLQGFEAVGPQLNHTMAQAQRTLATVEGSTKTLTGDLHELTTSLKQTSSQLNAMVGENRDAVRDFTGSGLYELTLLITQLRDLSGQLSRVVTRIENDPSNFLFGGTRQGVEIRGR